MNSLACPLVRIIAAGFLLVLLQINVSHCEPFVPKGEISQHFNSQFEYLEDTQGSLTISQILSGSAGPFKPLLKKNFGFGYHHILWIRFSVDFKNYQAPYWFLTQNYEHVGELTLFYPEAGGYRSSQILESTPASQRAFITHNYIFKVPTPQTTTAVYYMRFNPQGHVLTVDLTWAGVKGIVEFIHNSQLNIGLFFGGLLAMWFYNLILFASLRSRDYLYYLYYLGCFIATFIYLNGFAPLLIDSPKIYEPLFAAFAYGAIHGMTLFARQFLSLKKNVPWLDYYLKVFQWILFGGLLVAFFLPVGIPYPILNLLIVLTGPFLILAGLIRWYQGYEPASFYTIGWSVFVLSLLIYSFRLTGVLPANLVTNYAIQVASVWEAILFSLALAYRIKLSERKAALDLLQLEAARSTRKSAQQNSLVSARFVESEKKRIARELHDQMGQLLVAVLFDARAIAQTRRQANLTNIQERAGRIIENLNGLYDGVNNIIDSLRPELLDTRGLRQAIQALVDHWNQIVQSCEFTLKMDFDVHDLPDDVNISIYRITQESLTNTVKHSSATKVEIGIIVRRETSIKQDFMVLHIKDNGKGFDVQSTPEGGGLHSIRHRSEALGGTFLIKSNASKGTHVIVTLPLNVNQFEN